jgi:hypothetical protein
VNVFVQGMRRSGTTILFDALLEDRALRCFYEPLREQKVTIGGGSGAREVDAFAETRALREEFQRRTHPDVPIDEFNWGGPRQAELELDPDLPRHCLDFMRHLLSLAPEVAIKETRLYCKVPLLAELDAEAALIHVVRDPRAVAASVVLGRGRRRERRLKTADAFFGERSDRRLWSSRGISEHMLRWPEYRHVESPPDFLRVLMVWKLSFERTRADGMRLFGDRYLMLRNEDLRASPQVALASLYGTLAREMPGEVEDWAAANVASHQDVYAASDPRWAEAFEEIDLAPALAEAGYGPVLESAR